MITPNTAAPCSKEEASGAARRRPAELHRATRVRTLHEVPERQESEIPEIVFTPWSKELFNTVEI